MTSFRFLPSLAAALFGLVAGQAQAQLLGVTQTFPDTTAVASPYLVYDHNGINATTGWLRLVSGASTLAEGPAAGGTSITQSYIGAGDTNPDVLLSIQVRNGTGGFTAGSFVEGQVSIGFGNSATANRWKWDGAITALGFQSGTGSILDARWTVTADQYQNMPATMSQFANGYLTGGAGGIKINSSASWLADFTTDWVYGTSAAGGTNPTGGYRTDLTSPSNINSTVMVDIYATPVPEPSEALLLLAGLALLVPLARARKAH